LKSNTFFRKSQYIGLHLKLTRHAASAKIAFKLGVKNDTLVNLMLKKILHYLLCLARTKWKKNITENFL